MARLNIAGLNMARLNVASRDWRPLLHGDLATRAEEAVHAIAEALAAERWKRGFSLGGSGTAALALFYGYLARTAGAAGHRHQERTDRLLEHALESLATTPMGAALYSGFTGVAWAAEHLTMLLRDDGPGADDEDMSEEIDETLLTALTAPWTGDYDLISGLVGLGVYALERVPRRSAIRCLEAIVDRLDESAVRLGEGVAWFTSPDMLPSRNREENPDGYYNLGVAHGVPGVIGLLADACRLGIRDEKARPLLAGAVRWVLSHRLSARPGSCYPSFVTPGVEPQPSRLAWCYGDPGVAATLLYAARAVGREDWEREALDIAAHAARAAPEDSRIRDAGLCHGALGLAHIYNRIYQAVGDALFADAARLWYELGLDMRRPAGGIAGFEAWHPRPGMEMGWMADPGFLTGAAGIGLALLAGLTSIEPRWDRLLMVAIPPTH
jgi:hypothetical protein